MKPFDIKKAIEGDPVITRDGRPVTQLTFFKDAKSDTVAGVVDGEIELWSEDGKYSTTCPCGWDLFMAPKIRHGWVVISQGPGSVPFVRQTTIWDSLAEAKENWPSDTPARIEWEE